MKTKRQKKSPANAPYLKTHDQKEYLNQFFNTNILSYTILFAGTFFLYGWTSTFGLGLDDRYSLNLLIPISNNFKGILSVFSTAYVGLDYRPVAVLSFWLERFIFGSIDPGTSHFINTLIFAFLLTRIYRFIMVCRFYEDAQKLKLLALLTAVFFLVHPNHVSVVANIKSRDNLLSMTFGILSAIQFIKFWDNKKQWGRIFLIAAFLILGFLSKVDCYVFAIIPFLIIIMFRKVNTKNIISLSVTTFLLIIIAVVVKDKMFHNLVADNTVKYTFLDISKSPLVNNDTMINRISLALTSILYYLKFLLIPWGYYFYFGNNQIPLLPVYHPINILSLAVYISIGGCSIYFYKKNKIYLFCFLFFLFAIAYAINLFAIVAGIVMDRYNFIPSLAFCLALSVLCIDTTKLNDLTIFKNPFIIVLILFYSCFTIYRTSAWKDEMTLCNRDIPHLSKSFNALKITSGVYVEKALEKSVIKNINSTADKYIAIGESYADKAMAIYGRSPELWQTKGICDLYNGKDLKALEKFRKCKELDSNFLSGINYLGVAFRNLNMPDSANYYFQYVMNKEQFFNHSANNSIDILINNGKINEADSIIRRLKQRFPEDILLKKKIKELNWK